MKEFSSLLVANRGEIALRIMRTAKELGLRTIAVYSDADKTAPHVKFADDKIHIGGSPVGESYLVIEKIIDAAKISGAEAIHPGYGFLSENSAFSKAVNEAGLVFVGPPEHAIDVMGDKARSKRAMIKANIPCVPGYQGEDQSDERLIDESMAIGFPIMVKAAAGGGGRGMRLVFNDNDLPGAIQLARSEAQNAFGSSELIIEKAVQQPRHVEIQIFADTFGNTIHLGERDCSVQRRHQKIVEESPCPVMTEELRARMGKAAVDAAKAVDYVGAGTVEFLLDSLGNFYFLEMNTRLQVEHPVTELVTGLDLVTLQLNVAAGEPLGITQEEVTLNGHAIEVRLYAEDPENDFLPSTGPVTLWHEPQGKDIRVDSGIQTGSNVSPFYDPMVAKIIAHGETRNQARLRLIKAMKSSALFGLKSNRDFLIDTLSQQKFANGEATTAFIDDVYGEGGYKAAQQEIEILAAVAVLKFTLERNRALAETIDLNQELLNWSSTGKLQSVFSFMRGDETVQSTVTALGSQSYQVEIADELIDVDDVNVDGNCATLNVKGHGFDAVIHEESDGNLNVAIGNTSLLLTNASRNSRTDEGNNSGSVKSPMHGLLLEIAVKSGESVSKGDKLAVLEAMKMQHEIIANIDGVVAEISAIAGNQIAADELLLEIGPIAEE
ncbi:acetyl-CoA carboxylase biotin carboxylase subunit [Sneathiella marina]|uniref:Acetyl-CoA carboxylase biotin carboxylase subunit n=1 Tax=Sneathiella marina TaxID=2950108 RepID=A0ABY4W8K4_9PROT|nr:acetyl-CoA carboxylase biotin carboxylase subunit [Sneathiella marina]USG62468.1 acetyl-CoA carboxylase biotin carboxylase subunit [Sneathiella marina]